MSLDTLATNTSEIITVLGQINKNLVTLNATLAAVFPQVTGTAATATGGAATLPANPVEFWTVTNADGDTRLIPVYNP